MVPRRWDPVNIICTVMLSVNLSSDRNYVDIRGSDRHHADMPAPSRTRQLAVQDETVESWLSALDSPNTRAAYRSDLASFGRWCAQQGAIPLTADTTTLVAFHAAREQAGDSAATIRRKWSALSSFYDFAVRTQAASHNPTLGTDRPRVATGAPSPTMRLTPQAVESYRTLAASLDPRLEALVELLVTDGLKVSEALALDVDDVRGRHPTTTIIVRRRGEQKRVRLDAGTARAVRRCAAGRSDGPLFTNTRSTSSGQPERLTRFGVDHLIRQLTDDDEDRVTANALRRYHITQHAHSAPLEEIRDRAGLADVRSVRRYLADPD